MYGILFAILTGKDSTPVSISLMLAYQGGNRQPKHPMIITMTSFVQQHFNRMCVCVRDQFGVIVDRLRALMEATDFHRLHPQIVIKVSNTILGPCYHFYYIHIHTNILLGGV